MAWLVSMWMVDSFFLPHQDLQPPRHPSSHIILEALTLTLTQYLETTPMPTTWILQVSVELTHTVTFSFAIFLWDWAHLMYTAATWRFGDRLHIHGITSRLWTVKVLDLDLLVSGFGLFGNMNKKCSVIFLADLRILCDLLFFCLFFLITIHDGIRSLFVHNETLSIK